MRMALLLIAVLASGAARAAPLEISCDERITQQSYTGSGVPIPVQHITGKVEYTIDFARRTLTVLSGGKSTTFTDGGGQHIIVDHDGMTIAGNGQLGANGPVTVEIMHFSPDATRGTGERKLLMRGRLLQKADMLMICRPTTIS